MKPEAQAQVEKSILLRTPRPSSFQREEHSLELQTECKNDHCLAGRRIIMDNQNQPLKKQPIMEPRNTPNIRKSGRQKPRLLFCVFCVFRGKKSDPSDSRSNRLWNHGTHRTHGNQDVSSLGCFSVCSVYSVVKNPIPAIQEATD